MSTTSSKPEMTQCVHRESGKQKLCPKHWFKDPGLASSLDWIPMEIKKFEEPINDRVAETLKKEKDDEEKLKAEALKKEKETTTNK